MNKDEQRDRDTTDQLPPELQRFRQSWHEDAAYREHVLEEVAHWISKYGDFGRSGYFPALAAPGVLEPRDVLDLYNETRDRSGRNETEWRPEFEAAFPEVVGLLPPISRDNLLTKFTHELYWAVVHRDPGQVRGLLREMSAAGVGLSDLPKLCSGSLVGNAIYLDREGEVPELWITWSHLGRHVGSAEVEQLLLEEEGRS